MKKTTLLAILFLIAGNSFAQGWQIRQAKIDHIQAGNGEFFFISLSADTKTLADCESSWGADWVAVPLDNVTEKTKYMLSLAMSAQASGALVDVGGTRSNCTSTSFGALPIMTFIRVGDYTQ